MKTLLWDVLRPVGAGWLAAVWLSVSGGVALASSNPGEPPGIEAVVAEVLAANPELKAYESALEAAREDARMAGRLERPVLGVDAGKIRSRNLDGSLGGEGAVWSATVQQTFEWPGRLSLRKAIANHDQELARLGLASFRQALAGRARSLALGAAGAQEKARVTREVAERFRELREVLIQRDPAGVTPVLEIRILEATELGLRRRAGDRALEAGSAGIELNLLRGLPARQVAGPAWEAPRFEALPTDMDLLSAALTNNLELRTHLTELAQQGFRVALAKNERWPAFTVGPGYTSEDGSSRDRLVTLGVQVPLPLWKDGSANVAAATARRQQAEALLAASRREVERRVLIAAQRFASRREEMDRWRDDSVQAFRDAAALADRHYRLGAVPATTYVELQKQYLDAVESLLDTREDALASALELEQLTGVHLVGLAAKPEGRQP
jgi:outer membrane protein, heavy metal efflux system